MGAENRTVNGAATRTGENEGAGTLPPTFRRTLRDRIGTGAATGKCAVREVGWARGDILGEGGSGRRGGGEGGDAGAELRGEGLVAVAAGGAGFVKIGGGRK